MFDQTVRLLRAGALVLGLSTALAMVAPVAAMAAPEATIVLHTEWDVYQRPSGSQDSPMGFHVSLADNATAADFSGDAHTTSQYGRLVNGSVNGTSITFTIDWPDGKIGVYQGDWFADGYLRGHTLRPASGETAEWWSGRNNWTVSR